jgi:hypothetical protein
VLAISICICIVVGFRFRVGLRIGVTICVVIVLVAILCRVLAAFSNAVSFAHTTLTIEHRIETHASQDSLGFLLRKQSAMPMRESHVRWRILRPLTSALLYMHEHGVVHRDIKGVYCTCYVFIVIVVFGCVCFTCMNMVSCTETSKVCTARVCSPLCSFFLLFFFFF